MMLAYGEGWCQYYTGVRVSGYVLIKKNETVLFTKEPRLKTKSRILNTAPEEYLKKTKKLGIVYEGFPLPEYNKLKKTGLKIYDSSEKAWEKRKVKQKEEIRKLKKAVAWTAKVFQETLPEVTPGMTEKHVAAVIAGKLLEKAEALSFPLIVASGPNTEHIHWYPTNRKIKRGDLVIIDAGVIMNGYCSDMTRTLLLGNDKKKKELIEACKQAHISLQDHAPRTLEDTVSVIEQALGEKKRLTKYAYGHGIGIDVHEPPVLRKNETGLLKKGMVLAIEPGLHVKGLGGARIEDDYYYDGKKWEMLAKCERRF